jgi:type VI secretion system Hcp family effector
MAIYMKTPNINGSASDPQHKHWIELDGFQLTSNRKGQMIVGNSHDRYTGLPSFETIHVSKFMDKASPAFFGALCDATVMSEVKIHLTDNQGERVKYVLSDVIISERIVTLTDSLAPLESLSLSYSKIVETYIPKDKTHKTLSPFSSGYDLEKASSL